MTQERKRNYRRKQSDNLTAASTEMGNIPPQAVDVEAAVLGAMMVNPESVDSAIEILNEKSFYDIKHRNIFEAMYELYSERTPIDMLTVVERMKQKGTLAEIGGSAMLAALTQAVGTGANVEYYIRILQQKAIQRNLIDASYGILKNAFDETMPVDDLVNMASESVHNAISGNEKNPFLHVGQVVNMSMERIQSVQAMSGITGVHSGFTDLDSYTMGWQKGNLIILGARPSVGKTAFALNLALNVAKKYNKTVACFSLEMSREQLTMRLLANESFVELGKLLTGKLSEEEWTKLAMASAALSQTDLRVDDNPSITVAEINAKCRRLDNLGLVVIDYLQLMQGSGYGKASDNRVNVVSDISRSLKIMAKELNVPVICLSQLSRGPEGRTDKRPMLSDLRESGAIEQDADEVIFLYRDEYYNENTEEKGVAECIVAKNRHGETGTVKLQWFGPYQTFSDREWKHAE